jgi:menaquinone-specific isochorismate synthase
MVSATEPMVGALDLAIALHPSAAVCGTPTELARQTIAEFEGLDRGRYAAPVGWVDTAGNGELAIALRCGQLDPADPRRITLYAGCGIVAESDPDEEYAETKAKFLPMLTALDPQTTTPTPTNH